MNSNNLPALKGELDSATAAVLGPGLGMHSETKEVVKDVIEHLEKRRTPLLLDADGLKSFAEYERKLDCPLVLTPHTREYEILTGNKLPKDLEGKAQGVQKAAKKLGATILLKGPVDIVSDGGTKQSLILLATQE